MAATIPIDSSLNLSEEVADVFLSLMNLERVTVPKLPLPQILLAKTRSGMSSEILSAAIISRFPQIGIMTGPVEENTPNVMEALIVAICEEIIDMLQNDMRIDVAIDPGIILQASGANAGGPILAIGSTTQVASAVGIAR